MHITLQLLREVGRKMHHQPAQIVAYIRQRLRDDFTTALPLAELAEACGVTPEHLSRLYRRRTGIGIADERRQLRPRAAAAAMPADPVAPEWENTAAGRCAVLRHVTGRLYCSLVTRGAELGLRMEAQI